MGAVKKCQECQISLPVKAARAQLWEGTVWFGFRREQSDNTLPVALLTLVPPVPHPLPRTTADTFPAALIVGKADLGEVAPRGLLGRNSKPHSCG